jgi:hypothetical protein
VVFNVFGDLIEQISAARRQDQLNTLLGQCFGDPQTNASASTRDQCTLTSQI